MYKKQKNMFKILVQNLKYFRMNFNIYLFESNFLHLNFKICLGGAQKHSEGRML
jgi:hypothetical protein